MGIEFCRKCTISSMRPRITFNEAGVCSACEFAEKKAKTDWAQREAELVSLCDKYRSHDGSFDVVVPVSGGKDGGFTAHQLKYKYGMNPLCVSFAPLIPTEIGQKNLRAFIDSGFDVIQGHPNGQSARKLARLAFEHMGDPFQPFIYGQTNFPLRIAVQENIQLIMYGEDGEAEYGGVVKEARAKRSPEEHDAQYFSGKEPEYWEAFGIGAKELEIFKGPRWQGLQLPQIHFFGYYKKWDPQENFYYCSENTGFSTNPDRTEGTYSKYASLDDRLDGLHYYLAFIKFGIGRATSDSAHEIRDGKITREEGVSLVHKFDGEFPIKHFQECCEYMGLTAQTALKIIDSWRDPRIWDGQRLRYKVK
jgi:N-acetyl sugar amidotransferase